MGTTSGRLLALGAAGSVLLTACVGPTAAPGGPDATDAFAGFPSCADDATIAADPSLYRDEPQYGNAGELTDDVRAWAEEQGGFEELWLDRERNGWVTVGFHGDDVDAAALQERVAKEFPGEGVVVVEVPSSLSDLQTLMDRLMPVLADAGATPTGGLSLDVPRGRLGLFGVPATPEAEAALQQFAGEPLCVDVVDPAAFVPEGPQPTEGEGWRLLGHEPGAGEPYRTGVATTDEQLAALWVDAGLDGDAPQVDWEGQVVLWFGAVWGSGCPVRLDDVVVSGATLHGEIVVPGSGPDSACNGDANPHAFVVAVDRAVLPAGPFVVQLDADDPPPGAPQERTVVDVDLSVPGATATDEQIHLDPDAGPQPGPLLEDGDTRAPEPGARYVWRPRPECHGVVVGPFAGTLWRLADGEAEWTARDGQEVELHPVDEDVLVVSSPGMEHLFVPARDDVCDA
ncbi:MAG: hypothetical protein H5T83_04710 [Actinotalea sp.]|nr:hypothetical protein [Actinotalea sp.]